jgi:hypothetical protein
MKNEWERPHGFNFCLTPISHFETSLPLCGPRVKEPMLWISYMHGGIRVNPPHIMRKICKEGLINKRKLCHHYSFLWAMPRTQHSPTLCSPQSLQWWYLGPLFEDSSLATSLLGFSCGFFAFPFFWQEDFPLELPWPWFLLKSWLMRFTKSLCPALNLSSSWLHFAINSPKFYFLSHPL